jgi:DNA-binding NarL/FixJ family response regulator
MTTVLVVDDHALVRAGLVALLRNADRIEVVGAAADGREGVELATRLEPDVILMDLSMPVLDGLSATRLIRESSPSSRVVVLTSFADPQHRSDAIAAGAVGYLQKGCESGDIITAVRSAAGGTQRLVTPAPAPRWRDRFRAVPRQHG